MRGTPGLFLVVAVAAACSSGNRTGPDPDPDPDPQTLISVGGTYQTVVTLESNSCPGQTVETHPTTVRHAVGATTLTLGHAGSSYAGTLSADGTFTTTPVDQTFDGVRFTIGITGQFTETAMDAVVQVNAGRQPPCAFTARWAGPKSGAPNIIP